MKLKELTQVRARMVNNLISCEYVKLDTKNSVVDKYHVSAKTHWLSRGDLMLYVSIYNTSFGRIDKSISLCEECTTEIFKVIENIEF